MFWKYNFGSSAQIETLLGKEDVTLHELMEEDELLQECKAQNRKLIEFLTREDVLQELVNLVVNEPSHDKEMHLRFKYANLASELLTSDVPAIIDKLVASPSLLDVLYKFLEKEKPLNPLLASFFSKVLGMLVQRRSEQNWYSYQFTCFQVLDFLKSKGDFVETAVSHIGTSAIMDLLLRLICNVEEDEIRQSLHQWLCENQLVERLLERLSPEADSDEHTSAGQILCEIVVNSHEPTNPEQGTSSSIQSKLESEESVNKLLDLLLHEGRNESSVTHIINVLLTLLNSRTQPQSQHQQHMENQQNQQGLQSESSVDSSDSESGETRKYLVARTIAKRLPSVQNLLLHPPKKGLLMTAYGQEMEPLGSTRLQVITLITALVMTNDQVVHDALTQLNTIDHLLDIFFKFLLNNFVHTQVEKCLTAIITQSPPPSTPQSEPHHPLLSQLLTHCRIIQRIMDAHEQIDKEESKCPHNLRGYMGHLRQLANTIVQQAEFGPNETLLKQLIQNLPGDTGTQWDDFVSNSLAEINRKNEVQQLPVLGMRHHQESDEDSDDDSNFYPQTLHNPVVKQWISVLGSNLSGTGIAGGPAATGTAQGLSADQTGPGSHWGLPPPKIISFKNKTQHHQGSNNDYDQEEEEEDDDDDDDDDEDDEDDDEEDEDDDSDEIYRYEEKRQKDLAHNEANILKSMVSPKGNITLGEEKEKLGSKIMAELKTHKTEQVIIKTQIYTSKGFKEMDMDTIGDFRYADDEFKDHDFKDPDDNISLATASAAGSGPGGTAASVEEGRSAGPTPPGEDHDLFEEMCSARLQDMHDFDDMWTDKEKEITFSQESIESERSKAKESHSSSDEEEEDEELAGIRNNQDDKMEVDQDDWAEVFDKRSSGGSVGDTDNVNPWQSAPMSDTSQNSGWADFGAFGAPRDPFGNQNANKDTNAGESGFVANFDSLASQENTCKTEQSNAVTTETKEQNAFQADFSSGNFDSKFEAKFDVPKVTEGLQNSTVVVPPVGSEAGGTEVSKQQQQQQPEAPKGEGGGGQPKCNTQESQDTDLKENFNFLSSRGLLKNKSDGETPQSVIAAAVVVDVINKDSSKSIDSSSSSSSTSAETVMQEGGDAVGS